MLYQTQQVRRGWVLLYVDTDSGGNKVFYHDTEAAVELDKLRTFTDMRVEKLPITIPVYNAIDAYHKTKLLDRLRRGVIKGSGDSR